MLGQQGLVGSDDVFTMFEKFDHHGSCGLKAADQKNRYGDRRILRDVADVAGDPVASHCHVSRLGNVVDDRFLDNDGPTSMPGNVVGRFDEETDHARPDGAQTDNADTNWFDHRGNDSENVERSTDRNEPSLRLEALLVVHGQGPDVRVVRAVLGMVFIPATGDHFFQLAFSPFRLITYNFSSK